jgi:hypothetical protein
MTPFPTAQSSLTNGGYASRLSYCNSHKSSDSQVYHLNLFHVSFAIEFIFHHIVGNIKSVPFPTVFLHTCGMQETHFVLRPSFYLWSSEATKWVGILTGTYIYTGLLAPLHYALLMASVAVLKLGCVAAVDFKFCGAR